MAAQGKSKGLMDGIVNQQQFFTFGVFPAIYAAGVPLTSFMTKPGGIVEYLVKGVIKFLVPNGADIPANRAIPALAAVYAFTTFAFSGAWSVAGQAGSSARGLDNNHPRKHVNNLTGMGLRLRSAHMNLMENFPAWAAAAALAQVVAPADAQVVNLLGLVVLSKCFIYWPSYVFNISPPRSFAHLLATSSVVNVCLRLALL